MKIRPEQYPTYNYTSVHMNLNNEFYPAEKKQKKCYYNYYGSCTSKSFLRYLFSEKSVPKRLMTSLFPPYGSFNAISTDFEGSLLNIILLMIVVYNRIWMREKKLFLLLMPCLYVGLTTLVIRGLSSLTRTRITLRELFCLISYGLFGHTLALLVSNLFPELFIASLIVLGGLSSVRLCCVLLLRTRIPPYRFVICTPLTIIHWLFLLYVELKTN